MFSQKYFMYSQCIQRHFIRIDAMKTLLQYCKFPVIPSKFIATQCALLHPVEKSQNMSRCLSDTTKRKGSQRKLSKKVHKILNKTNLSGSSPIMLKKIVDTKSQLNSDKPKELVAETKLSNFKILTLRCGVASREGDLERVRDLSEYALKHYPVEFGQHLSFGYYLALAEFHSDRQAQALDRITSILSIPKTPSGRLKSKSANSKLCYPFDRGFTRSQLKKVKDTTCLLLMHVPSIDDHSLWDQADALVQSLSIYMAFDRPAYILWKAYFFSHLHPEFERCDGLLERHPAARRLVCEKLKDIVQLLLNEPSTDKVVHLLQQLLKYNLTGALSPITSLLLTMHCQNGSSTAALETFRFAYKLRIPLSSVTLVQFQHLLHQSRTKMPEELVKLKYSSSTTKPSSDKILPWKF